MGNSVDQRIVQMQFDNAQFERGVATTMSSLKKLDKSLALKDGASGLKEVDKTVSSMDFSTIQGSLDQLNNRFSLLGTAASAAVTRITNSLMDVGGRMLKSLTVDPITDGLSEYELKLGSVQTIMANTGLKGPEGMEKITATLDDLNDYADKTIYNFAEMTRNIGTFTAAGVGLEDAATAIKGISNLAAASGSNSQQASTAMYQLSQALAAGSVKLMDWNSVVNAGMGGQLFQERLMENARLLGTGVDEALEKHGNFRESLTEGWITSDVLLRTLRNLTLEQNDYNRALLESEGYSQEQIESIFDISKTATDAATKVRTFSQLIDTTKEALGSGWATSWEYILGDMLHAQDLWTSISNAINGVIGEFDGVRNTFLRAWNTGKIWDETQKAYVTVEGVTSGWEAMFEAIQNVAGLISDVIRPITDAFDMVFQFKQNAESAGIEAAKATMRFRDFTKQLRDSFNNSAVGQAVVLALRTAFIALFTVIKAVGALVGGAVFVAFQVISTVIGAAAEGIEFFASKIRDAAHLLLSMDLSPFFEGIQDFLTSLFGDIPIVSELTSTFSELVHAVLMFAAGVKSVGEEGNELAILDYIRQLQGVLQGKFGELLASAKPALEAFASGLSTVATTVAGGVFQGMLWSFDKLQQAWAKIVPIFDDIKGKLVGAWSAIKEAFSAAGFSTEPFVEMFTKIGEAFNTFIDSIIANGFSFDALAAMFGSIGSDITGLFDSIAPSFSKFFSSLASNVKGPLQDFLNSLAAGEGPLSMLANLIKSVTEAFSGLGSVKLPFVSGGDGAKTEGVLTHITSLMTTMGGLAKALKNPLGAIADLLSGGVNAFLSAINQFVSGLDSSQLELFVQRIAKMAGLGLAAAGLYNFANVLKALEGVIEGIDLSAFFGLFHGLTNLTKSLSMNLKAKAVKEIAISIGILVGALVLLSMMDPERLQQVIPILAGVAAGLVVAMGIFAGLSAIPKLNLEALTSFAAAMISFAGSIAILSGLVVLLGSLPSNVITQGVATMSGLMILVTAMGMLSSKMQGFTDSSKSIKNIATAMLELSVVVAILGLMPSSKVAQGYVVLMGITMLIAALAIVLSHLKNVASFQVSVAGVGGIAAAILAIAAAVAILALLPADAVNNATLAVIKLMGVLALVMALFTILDSGAGNVAKSASAFVVVAAAVGVLALAVAGLAVVSALGGDISAGINAIIMLILALSVAAFILGQAGPVIENGTRVLTAFAVVVALLAAAVIAMTMLADSADTWTAIGQMAVIILVLVAAFGALAGIGQLLTTGVVAVSMFVAAIGAAALAIGLAAVLIASSLAIMAQVGPEAAASFVESLRILGSGIWDAKGDIALGIAGIVLAILGGLAMCIPGAAAVLLAMIGALLGVLVSAAPILAVGAVLLIIGFIDGLATALEAYGPKILEALGHLFTVIIEGIGGIFVDGLNMFNEWLYEATGGLMGVEPQAKEAAESTVDAYAGTLKDGTGEIDDAFGDWKSITGDHLTELSGIFGEGGGDNMMSWLTSIQGGADPAALMESMDLPPEIREQLNSLYGQYGGDAISSYNEGAEERAQEEPASAVLVDQLSVMSETGQQILAGARELGNSMIFNGFDVGVASASASSTADESLASSIDGVAATASAYQTGLEAAVSGTQAFFSNFKMDTSQAVNAGVQTMTTAQNSYSAAGQADGASATSGLSSGLSRFSAIASEKVASASGAVRGIGQDMYNAGSYSGSQAGAGLLAGLESTAWRVRAKAAEIASNVASALKNALAIKSPSKVTREIGMYVGEGLIAGMDAMRSATERSGETLAYSAISKMATQASAAMGLLDDMDYAPVITPVLDTSSVEEGASYISGLLSDVQQSAVAAINASVGYVTAPGLLSTQQDSFSNGPVYNMYIDGAIVNGTPEIQRVIYETFEVVSAYGGMNHGN